MWPWRLERNALRRHAAQAGPLVAALVAEVVSLRAAAAAAAGAGEAAAAAGGEGAGSGAPGAA